MPELISDDESTAPPHKIEEHMDKLTATLQELKGGVEEEIAQQASKRPRVDGTLEQVAKDADMSNTQDGGGQPFQKGGK